MATPSDEVEVQLVEADANAAGAVAESTAAADEAAATADRSVLTPDDGVEKLRTQLAESERLRHQETQRADAATAGHADALKQTQKSHLEQITVALASKKQEGDVLEGQLAEAWAAQDFTTASKIQRKLSGVEADVRQLEGGKAALEKAPPPEPPVVRSHFEDFVGRLEAPSASWVRAHPEWIDNGQKQAQLMAAHDMAMARHIKPESREYFEAVEKSLDIQPNTGTTNGAAREVAAADTTGADDPMSQSAKEVKPAQPAAAPVSRSNGSQRSNTVRLSAEQVEMAKNCGMTNEEYAKQLVMIQREGKNLQ